MHENGGDEHENAEPTPSNSRGVPDTTDSDAFAWPSDAARTVYYQTVNNNVAGDVNAGSSNMGFAGSGGLRRRTGPLDEREIIDMLRFYVPPSSFSTALDGLTSDGIVVLEGAEGIGKRAGALALLRKLDDSCSIVGLPPTMTLPQLADHSFTPGAGYLLQDWNISTRLGDAVEFDLQQLRRKLKEVSVSLIATTTRNLQSPTLRQIAVRWEPPDAQELLQRAVLERFDDIDDLLREQLSHRYSGTRSPRGIVAFADRVERAGGGRDDLARILDDSERSAVANWFDGTPTVKDVLFITTLAFVHGVAEHHFESALAALARSYAASRSVPVAGSKLATENDDRPADEPFEQTRNWHTSCGPLARVQLDDSDDGVRRVAFEAIIYRERVLNELWSRYGPDLWKPVGAWLCEIVTDADRDRQLSISLGLALLAQTARRYVRDDYLEPWAEGDQAQRLVAAFTVWWLARGEATAPFALAIATEWAAGRNDRKRITATLCLAGEPGLRYPGEALRWLWHLATGSTSAAIPARKAICDLFGSSTLGRDLDTSVLRWVTARLEKARRRGAAAPGYGTALEVVCALLAYQIDRGSAVAALLTRHPDVARLVGPLWAEGIINRRSRTAALWSLREALRALERTDPDRSIIANLGAAICAALPDHEVPLLRRDLHFELSGRSALNDELATSIIEVLLTSWAGPGPESDGKESTE